MAYRGDLIVCLVDFNKIDGDSRIPIIFTLNGTLIYEALMKYEQGKRELYPFIGMCHKGIRVLAKVRVIFCQNIMLYTKIIMGREVLRVL